MVVSFKNNIYIKRIRSNVLARCEAIIQNVGLVLGEVTQKLGNILREVPG
jgi:hypothetical protein